MVRAGRLQSLGGNVQPSIGAKKVVEQDEVVIVHLRETSTETVLSLPSFITASDMREVRKTTRKISVHCAYHYQASKSIAETSFSIMPRSSSLFDMI
jgi:hypothetical protein